MLDAHNYKLVSVTPPGAAVNGASATTTEIDTAGWEYARILVQLGATDAALSALSVTESATSGSGHTAVEGLVFGTDTDADGAVSALPTAEDDDGFFVFEIDLRARERYLDVAAVVASGTTGAYLAIWAELYRGDTLPSTVAGHGATGMLVAG